MANKRGHIRILVAMRVRAETTRGRVQALTKNLSCGGVYLLTDARWPSGTDVGLVLEHKGVHVELRGKVTDAREDGVGVRFEEPTPTALTELIGVIDDILSSGASLDGGQDMLEDERLVLFRRGLLEYSGLVDECDEHGITVATTEKLRDGEALVLLLPARSDGAHVREIVGSFAQVVEVLQDGFTARFIEPSTEFQAATERMRE